MTSHDDLTPGGGADDRDVQETMEKVRAGLARIDADPAEAARIRRLADQADLKLLVGQEAREDSAGAGLRRLREALADEDAGAGDVLADYGAREDQEGRYLTRKAQLEAMRVLSRAELEAAHVRHQADLELAKAHGKAELVLAQARHEGELAEVRREAGEPRRRGGIRLVWLGLLTGISPFITLTALMVAGSAAAFYAKIPLALAVFAWASVFLAVTYGIATLVSLARLLFTREHETREAAGMALRLLVGPLGLGRPGAGRNGRQRPRLE